LTTSPWILIPLIGIAGGLGSILRVYLTRWNGALPFGLIATNSLAAGFLGYLFAGPGLSADYQSVLVVGFASGLSTFSSVSQAAWEFWHNGRLVQMLLTLITNILIPLTAMMLVLWLW
jgi:fluoride exporter